MPDCIVQLARALRAPDHALSRISGDRLMESIQVPDEVTVRVDMHEVQVHLSWPEYDIALPLHILRQLSTATDQLVEQVGGPLTAHQARRVAPDPQSS